MKLTPSWIRFILYTLALGVLLSVVWIISVSSQSTNLEATSAFQQKMVQVTGEPTGAWAYVNSSGEVQKTRDCGTSNDFWNGRRCAETEDGLVTFKIWHL